jgi:sugar phosphate isomerase/epimerase
MGVTRREFGRQVGTGLIAASIAPAWLAAEGKAPSSKIRGVQIGAQSYSFRDRPLDQAIEGYVTVGINSCELFLSHCMPADLMKGGFSPEAQQARQQWRKTVTPDTFAQVRKKFDAAGIQLSAFNYSFNPKETDEELAQAFEFAKALGVKVITSSSPTSMPPRIAPLAEKHGIIVGFHNHSKTDGDDIATPERMEAVLNMSKFLAINLDIGHFTAADFDAVDFITKHHDRLVTLHLKDRKKHQGDNMPFGEGETPIVAVLQLLRDKKWAIPANIEYEYKGADTIEAMKSCLAYCRKALEG